MLAVGLVLGVVVRRMGVSLGVRAFGKTARGSGSIKQQGWTVEGGQ